MTSASPPSPPAITPQPSAATVVRLLAADIKLAHSVFALPFALLATFLVSPFAGREPAQGGWLHLDATPRFVVQLVLVVACMVLARTWAMLVNRLVDRDIDARNARTRRRVFASGAVSARQGWTVASLCALAFLAVCALFWLSFANPWPLALAPIVLVWIAFYSFTKRFSALCHLVLGVSLAMSPLAAALAIDPPALTQVPALWWLAGFVLCWVAGFDVIYALQDRDFDRANQLSSIPARLGTAGALHASRLMHVASLACVLMAWHTEPRFGILFLAGIACVLALLLTEHIIVARLARQSLVPNPDGSDNPPPALNMAFFTLNGVVSCLLGVFGVLEVFF